MGVTVVVMGKGEESGWGGGRLRGGDEGEYGGDGDGGDGGFIYLRMSVLRRKTGAKRDNDH